MTRCMKIFKDGTYIIKNFKTKNGQIKDGGKSDIAFLPSYVLRGRKKRFLRSRRPSMLIFVEDALNAVHFDEENLEKLQLAWGKVEARDYLFKLEALASMAIKPLKMWQFAVIMLMLFIAIALGVMNMSRLGALGL